MRGKIFFILAILLFFIPGVVAFSADEWGSKYDSILGNAETDSTDTGGFSTQAGTIATRSLGSEVSPLFLEYDSGSFGVWTINGQDIQLWEYDENSVGYMSLIDEFEIHSTSTIRFMTAIPTLWNDQNNTDAENTILVTDTNSWCDAAATTRGFSRIFYNTSSGEIERFGSRLDAGAGLGLCNPPTCDTFTGTRDGTLCYFGENAIMAEYDVSQHTYTQDTISAVGAPGQANGDCDTSTNFATSPKLPAAIYDMDGDGVKNIAICGSNGNEAIIFLFEQDQFAGASAGLGDITQAGDSTMTGVMFHDLDGGDHELIVVSREEGSPQGIDIVVYDNSLTVQNTFNVDNTCAAGDDCKVSNAVIADFTDTNDETICVIWSRDQASTADSLNLYCREYNAGDTERATIASGANADDQFFEEYYPIFAHTLDESTTSYTDSSSINYDLSDHIMISSASGYIRTLVALTNPLNDFDDKVVLYDGSDNQTHRDKFAILGDVNDDDIADIIAIEASSTLFFLPTFINSLPNLTAKFGVNLAGTVCLNTFRTWTAEICEEGVLGFLEGTFTSADRRCNFVDNIQTENFTLYSNCGNGTAQINGTSTPGTTNGIANTISLSCYFDTVGPRAFEICIEDEANAGEQNENSCLPITLNVINSTQIGTDCNFACSGAECFAGLASNYVSDPGDTEEPFTSTNMRSIKEQFTGGEVWVDNFISMMIIIGVILFIASTGSHPFMLYVLMVSVTCIFLSMLTLMSWTVSFVFVGLSFLYLILTGMFDVGGES